MSDDSATESPASLQRLRYLPASDLDGSNIGEQVMVAVFRHAIHGSAPVVGVLTDVERQGVGMRTAHLALHANGRVCARGTTVRTARVAVFVAGLQLFLAPDHPVLVRPVGA